VKRHTRRPHVKNSRDEIDRTEKRGHTCDVERENDEVR
jgi:hypothetical protein